MSRAIWLAAFGFYFVATCPPPSQAAAHDSVAPTDPAIVRAVSERIFNDGYLNPKSIEVRSDDGVVTLTGLVSSLRGKQRKVEMAETIRGVRVVVDRLMVSAIPVSDAKLQQDVQTALKLDATTKAFPVGASAQSGVVILTGKVTSRPERKLAEWVVSGVAGVRQVDNRIALTPAPKREDPLIVDDIREKLRQDPWVSGQDVQVAVSGGGVQLVGAVLSAASKRRAIDDAWVSGVAAVKADNLSVNPMSRPPAMKANATAVRSDAELRQAILNALVVDPRVRVADLRLTVIDGMATLDGTADSLVEKQAAISDARNTVGVVSAVDHLVVRPRTPPSDPEIARDVETYLNLNSPKIAGEVRAEVSAGQVTLTGTVNDAYQKWEAWDAASRVSGVTGINDQVRVRSVSRRLSDQNVRRIIQKSLDADSLIAPSDDVQVSVNQSHVTLTGQVENWGGRIAAGQAARASGAQSVDNRIVITGYPQKYPVQYSSGPSAGVYETYAG